MAIRPDSDDYQWARGQSARGQWTRRDDRGAESPSDEGDYGPLPVLNDTLIELAVTIAGFVGVLLVIFAAIKVFQ